MSTDAPGLADLFWTNEDIVRHSPFGRDVYWRLVKVHPEFPRPVLGGPGRKQLYGVTAVRRFFERVAQGEIQL